MHEHSFVLSPHGLLTLNGIRVKSLLPVKNAGVFNAVAH